MTGTIPRIALAAVMVAAGAPSVRAAESERQKIEKLEREVDELRDEIRELKQERKGHAEQAAAPEEAAAAPDLLAEAMRRVQIGGYGSVRFEHSSADESYDTFTFRRFVLTTDAAIAPTLRFYAELEFERFRALELERKVEATEGGLRVEQAIEGTNESEISLEQAFLEYALHDAARLQIGALLVPLGRFNLNHDDNRWDLPRRSLVDRGAPVLPVKAAWDELGVGLAGNGELGAEVTANYRLAVVNGATFAPELEEIAQTRDPDTEKLELEAKFSPSTGTFGNDVKDAKAVTGRLALSPALGHEIAGSFYYGRYTPDFLPSESIKAFGVDGLTTWGPFELEGEFILSDFGDVDRVARAFAKRAVAKEGAIENESLEAEIEFEVDSLAEQRRGYWIEPRWRFHPAWLKRSFLGRPFEDPVVTAVLRWEQAWLDGMLDQLDFEGGEVTALEKSDRRVDRFTLGGSYRPVPLVAFQLAYEFTKAHDGTLSDLTNFIDSTDDESHAVLVGAAFGF